MKPFAACLLAATLALTAGACATVPLPDPLAERQAAPIARQTLALEQGWRFRFGSADEAQAQPGFDDADWQQVSVPHTWNRIGEYALTRSEATNNDQGTGWYRLTVDAPAAPQGWQQYLDFAAVGAIADVWVNGVHVGQHRGAFSRFRLDVTSAWRPGTANLIAVRADNSRPAPGSSTEHVIPLAGDFFINGGIYRPASLLQLPPASIDPLDHGGPGVYARATSIMDDIAKLEVITRLRNVAADQVVTLAIEVADADGGLVAQTSLHLNLPDGPSEISQQIDIPSPHLWNGRADPYLYTVSATLSDASGAVLDRVEQPLGLRTFAFDADSGFSLNGTPMRLQGVSRHQDWQGSGWALSAEQHRRDMELIAEIGANTVRHAHYQHADEWSALADEFGMVTAPELPFVGMPAFTGSEGSAELWANAEQQLRELIRQNYNHPSIAMWSIGNEVDSGKAFGAISEVPQPLALLQHLNAIARAEDPHRPTFMADFSEQQGDFDRDRQALTGVTDLMGYNRYPGWYYLQNANSGRALGGMMDRLHAAHPGLPLSITEYGAGGAPSQHSDDPLSGYVSFAGRPQPEEYQTVVHELLWPAIASRDYIFASWVWNMFDFPSDLRNEGDSVDINTKGLVTMDRNYRKDAFYYYQAAWTSEPMIHLTGQGYAERSYPVMDVKAYTNAGRASLTVNGVAIAEIDCPNFTCVWPRVALHPGTNAVVVSAAGLSDAGNFDGIDARLHGLFIDAGSLAVSQIDGRRYGSDTFVAGGTPVARDSGAIGARRDAAARTFVTSQPRLFDFWRQGEAFSYALPLPAGNWTVTLRLLDPAIEAQPDQALRVTANGIPVVSALNLAEAAGGQARELVRSFAVTTEADGLTLAFNSTGGIVGLAAIEVTPR